MTYYILPNHWPNGRVSLHLAVRAGSVMEDDDQQGLAHLLEHMMFQGTKNFPGNVWPFLEQYGAKAGADVNAHTSYDRTVYTLDLPATPDSIVDLGIRLLADFAFGATLDEKDLDTERGVVLEEWRFRRTSGQRLQDVHSPVIYSGSRRADRPVIGKPEIIRTAPASRLRDFYRDWYRPERMAVIVVGDVNPAIIEALIRRHFGNITASSPPRSEPNQAIPHQGETLISRAADPEAVGTMIEVGYRREIRKKRGDISGGDLEDRVFEEFLQSSLWDLLGVIEKPLRGLAVSHRAIGPGTFMLTLRCPVVKGRVTEGLTDLLLEVERLAQQDVSAARLQESKDKARAGIRNDYENRNALFNDDLADDCGDHFFNGADLPDIESAFAGVDEALARVTVEEIQDRLAHLVLKEDRLVLISAPNVEDLPAVEEIGKALDEVGSTQMAEKELDKFRDADPLRETVVDHSLIAYEPKAGSVTGRRRIEDLDVTVLTLSNGAEVWLKPLMDRPDEILFEVCAPGGLSLAEPKHFQEAAISPRIARIAGCGGFQKRHLDRALAGRTVDGRVYVSAVRHGIRGSTTPRDLEAALQLIHGTLRELPNREVVEYTNISEIFLELKKDARQLSENRDPDRVMSREVNELAANGHYSARALSEKDISNMAVLPSIEFYRNCFSNAADFRFVFTGAFSEETLIPLIEKYLASIPSDGKRHLAFVDRGITFPEKTRKETVEAGIDSVGRVALTFYTPVGTDPVASERLGLVTNILTMRLNDVLRQDLGAIYSLRINSSDLGPFSDHGTTTIEFGCSPERADSLPAVVLEEIGRWQSSGPEVVYLERLKATRRRDIEEEEKSNRYWSNALQEMCLRGTDDRPSPARILDALTPETIRADLERYFSRERFIQVVLKPVPAKKR